MENAQHREQWDKWMDINRAVDDARGLILLAEFDCASSIADTADRENAHRALISASSALLGKAAALLPAIEPKSSEEAA